MTYLLWPVSEYGPYKNGPWGPHSIIQIGLRCCIRTQQESWQTLSNSIVLFVHYNMDVTVTININKFKNKNIYYLCILSTQTIWWYARLY